jgi:hypothetical protein
MKLESHCTAKQLGFKTVYRPDGLHLMFVLFEFKRLSKSGRTVGRKQSWMFIGSGKS